MLKAATAGRIVRKAGLGVVGVSVVGGTGLTAYACTENGAGFRREVRFWRKVAPVVFDYYIKTASSSPLVKYQNWISKNNNDNENDKEATKKEKRKLLLKELHEIHAPDILSVMLELKGLYIKLGQVLSVTVLPIPEQYRALFRTLQSDVPGWETFDDVIKPVLEREFGKPLDQVFEFVDPVPCGAASIGQAHRARLKSASNDDNNNDDDGRDVIIKVQYPDAAWQVPADIQCVGDFLKVCVWAGAVDESAATMSYDEFARQFLAELDYDSERANLQEVHKSSLDPTAPYAKRNVVIPKVYEDLCTKKVITMTYLPGPKLEEEAKRQLELLGIDTSKGIGNIVRDAAKDASDPSEPESGELVRRVTKKLDNTSRSPFSWKVTTSKLAGRIFGVDSLLWAFRFARRLLLWSQAASVACIQVTPRILLPSSWESWADGHRTAAAQAERLSLTEFWLDALFDVHGHQIFNLGLFNADPHPGNILVIEKDCGTPTNKLGLIDYGQVKRLTPTEQTQIAKLILSVADDASDVEVAGAFRDLGITTKHDSTAFLAKFARLMFGPLKPEHLDHGWHREMHTQDRVLYFPKELSMVYRTSLLLRGLAVSLQMNYSVSDQWKSHAQEALQRSATSTPNR